MSDKLIMTFQPRTIQHLGAKMYSQVPAAIAELVANAYDADATEVKISLYDKQDKQDKQDKRIVIEDNGCGMNFNELNEKFLRIGRNRREEEEGKTDLGRLPSGKKGLGKLALFGLGDTVIVKTKKERDAPQSFSMNWSDIKESSGDYEPALTDDKLTIDHGTQVTVSDLKRKSPFNQEAIVDSLSKLFVCFGSKFKVSVSVNGGQSEFLNNESKFKGLNVEFKWEDFSKYQYARGKGITGKIITTVKPLKPGMRGITLYANGRLVSLPEFYGTSDSSHFYGYVTGILNIDFIDKHSGDDDLIATNRQALDWDHEQTVELKKFLQGLILDIQKEWRVKRKEKAVREAKPTPDFDYAKWLNTLPEDKADAIKNLFGVKMEDNDSASRKDIQEALHAIIPEYATLHWRYLRSSIADCEAVTRLYKQKNYYQAVTEALKLYIDQVREISRSSAEKDYGLMGEAFKEDEGKGKIQLTTKITSTERNIEKGHADLSRGVVAGFRNPLAHELEDKLKKAKLITEEDCLDILSLLSHLFSRLDRRISPSPDS